MSATNNIIFGRANAKSGCPIFARIQNVNTGAYLTQASLSSISYKITDLTLQAMVATRTLTIGSVIFDTLQTADSRWTQDATGYNFAYTIPAADLTFAASEDATLNPVLHSFQVDIQFVLASGEPETLIGRILVAPVFL